MNGSPTAEFCPEKGLRQGDPLSPFLFIIVAEGLNMLFQRAKDLGLIKGVVIGARRVSVTYLQFADDTVVFCEAEEHEILNIKRILRCFEVLSGLQINFHKRKVCGVGVQLEVLADFADKLNCLGQNLPFTYLGLPLGASPKKKHTWLPVINNFKSKLASWRRKVLSFGGRLTLIRSVLNSLAVFYLSLFKVPAGVAKLLDKIQARFLWGGSEVKKKLHMVNWEEITKKKGCGGLGIRRLRDVNECLLAKWWWRYGGEDQALWKEVIISKYSSYGGRWRPFLVEGGQCSRIWGDILSLEHSSPNLFSYFMENSVIKVRNGRRISFWEEHWSLNCSLRSEFPRLFELSEDKESSLQQMIDRKISSDGWSSQFRRGLRAWEEDEVGRLRAYLSTHEPVLSDKVDSWVWKASASGMFSVKSLYSRSVAAHGVEDDRWI